MNADVTCPCSHISNIFTIQCFRCFSPKCQVLRFSRLLLSCICSFAQPFWCVMSALRHQDRELHVCDSLYRASREVSCWFLCKCLVELPHSSTPSHDVKTSCLILQ